MDRGRQYFQVLIGNRFIKEDFLSVKMSLPRPIRIRGYVTRRSKDGGVFLLS